MTAGMLLAAGGMAWLAHLTPSAGYASHVLPAVMILGVGMGSTIAPAMFTATYDLPHADTGVAPAMVNTMQQVGGAVGASGLTTIFAGAVSSYLHAHARSPGAMRGRLCARLHDRVLGLSGRVATGAILVGVLVPSIKAPAAIARPTEFTGSTREPVPSRG